MQLPTWLPAIPYPPSGPGYWGEVTSTINWCEEDYYGTIYSAEIVNTLTNLMFVMLAVKGATNCLIHKHDRIFLVTYAGYAAVGTGSILFHSSLKYPMQLIDELSMIYTTCFSCYSSFSYRRSRTYSFFVALTLISLAAFITGYYHYIQDPVFHQRMYALLTATVLLRSMWIMEWSIRPSLKARSRKHHAQKEQLDEAQKRELARQDRRDAAILRTMWAMVAYGLTIFLLGFAIWNLDNKYCSTLRRWRREIGLPWGILLEGHGWWHLMTGIGAYFYIMWGVWLRHCLNGKQDLYELYWPRTVFSLPAVVLRGEDKVTEKRAPIHEGNGHAKGVAAVSTATASNGHLKARSRKA